LQIIDLIANQLGVRTPSAAKKEALWIFSSMAGALVLSRVVTGHELSSLSSGKFAGAWPPCTLLSEHVWEMPWHWRDANPLNAVATTRDIHSSSQRTRPSVEVPTCYTIKPCVKDGAPGFGQDDGRW
jgi:hypothetical protein